MRALSIRPPWAFAIVRLGKDIENRSWEAAYRGPLLVCASMKPDLEAERFICRRAGIPRLPAEALKGGCALGIVDVVDCVDEHSSPWFEGDYGFVLANPRALATPFPVKGKLGLFQVDVPNEVIAGASQVKRFTSDDLAGESNRQGQLFAGSRRSSRRG